MVELSENIANFEQRKRDHIEFALDNSNQTQHLSQLEQIRLIPEALPECNLSDVSIKTNALGLNLSSPLFISSMTAGHQNAVQLNTIMAQAASEKDWLMGVGSQRRELFDDTAAQEWAKIRQSAPAVKLMANIGLSQVIQLKIDQIKKLCDNIQAVGLIVHCNALQEAIQPEGTPHFKNGLRALETLCKQLDCPVILKETGSGFSVKTLSNLNHIGLTAVDLAGTGGTHWGRIEGKRAAEDSIQRRAAHTFKDWGISSVETLKALRAESISLNFNLWGSGGIRNGLDAAKLIAMGCQMVGLAKPILEKALGGESALQHYMDCLNYELKVALFCTGNLSIKQFQESQIGTK